MIFKVSKYNLIKSAHRLSEEDFIHSLGINLGNKVKVWRDSEYTYAEVEEKPINMPLKGLIWEEV